MLSMSNCILYELQNQFMGHICESDFLKTIPTWQVNIIVLFGIQAVLSITLLYTVNLHEIINKRTIM